MSDVFVSYARSSERQARATAAALRSAGYSVWFDEDLPTHRAYGDVIEEQLASAKAVVVIWSAEAVRSQWVRAEANRAREEGKLVQLTLDKSNLPLPFDQVQCADLSGWTGDGEHPGWMKVTASIAALVGGGVVRSPTPTEKPSSVEILLAVLPFDAQPPDAETQALADGVSEDIIQSLTSGGVPKVIGRTGSFRFRGEAKASAAEALRASHILDGAVRSLGARVRVSVQLTESASGAVVWGERYDRDASDLFAVQDEVAALVAQAIRAALPESPGPESPRPKATAADESQEGERRHLTVLACGLADPEQFAGLDPEHWRSISLAFHEAAVSAAGRFDGHVAKSAGDGLEVYFGYPEAREDAAECAVRAGLAIVERMDRLNIQLNMDEGRRLEARVGVHAGTVVVSPGGGKDVDMFGEAPRTASAIQVAAPPNSVLISGVVHDLVSGLFVVEEMGEQRIAGVDNPIRLLRAVRAGLAGGIARGFASRDASSFVGREEEVHLLESRWRRVCDGEGQTVLLLGDAGIGKTRLIEEFRERIKADPHLWIKCAGAPLYANTPFHVVARMLDQGLDWGGEETPGERIGRLEQTLEGAGLNRAEAVPLIADMLGLPVPDSYAPLIFPPDQRRARLLAALTAWVFSATRRQPLIIAIEDLQWVDPSTMELVQTLVEQGARAPILLLLSARVEFRAAWSARGHQTQIMLSRLSDGNILDLIEGLTLKSPLQTEMLREIAQRADGVPLFAEELARLLTKARGMLPAHAIPVTLRDSLAARLDRLGGAREVAQFAAVLGREFSYELIAAVSPMPEVRLQVCLARLVEDDVLLAHGLPPYANYFFKHALMQDAAYDALLKSKRRELHGKVARTITSRFAGLADAQPEMIARHWAEAGEAAPAIAAWSRVGEAAYARRAFKEAEGGYRQALTILLEQAPSAQRDAQELELSSQLTRMLALTRGYAAPETVEVASRAKALAEKSGSTAQLIREEGRIWQAVLTAGDYAGASALADHILALAHGDGDKPSRLLFAHNAQLQSRFYTGDLEGVEEHFALMSPLLDAPGVRQAPGNNVISIGVASLAAWTLGHGDIAKERTARAAALAERTKDPYDLAMTLHFQGILSACEGDAEGAAAVSGRLLALAEENGLSYAAELAKGTLGWARARLGAVSEGLALMRSAATEPSGALVGRTFGLTLAAKIEAMAGESELALGTLERALTINPQERVFRPFTLSYRAELRLERGEATLAREDFRQAIDLARTMGARAWEARASAGLKRLLVTQGAAGEAGG
ncbi:MAG: AAA family ATPase [Caulobacteraceae bacterium]